MQKLIKNLRFKAVIFDMDGVLIDSEHWWQKWEKKFLTEQLGSWNKERQQRIIGRSLKDIHRILQDKYNMCFDVVVSAEDVYSLGKPAPNIYLYTARK
ncbi:MAG: HAD family hydrolase [Patescibacteria group bacterium]